MRNGGLSGGLGWLRARLRQGRWRRAMVVVTGAGLTHLAIGVFAVTPAAAAPEGDLPPGWSNTQWGPFSPADRALVEGVRRADLWEGPAGAMAVAKGTNPRVREIGAIIGKQHTNELDPEVLKIAGQLGISIPSQPNEDQFAWLAEMEQSSGAQFDAVFVDRLRLAHSKVFQLIATVRANTRNSLIRAFAITANKYVDNHMNFLDSTGLVRYELLPTPAAPAPTGPQPGNGTSNVIIWVVLAVAIVAGGATTARVVRSR